MWGRGEGGLPIVGYMGSPGWKLVPFKARSILKGRENCHFSIWKVYKTGGKAEEMVDSRVPNFGRNDT